MGLLTDLYCITICLPLVDERTYSFCLKWRKGQRHSKKGNKYSRNTPSFHASYFFSTFFYFSQNNFFHTDSVIRNVDMPTDIQHII